MDEQCSSCSSSQKPLKINMKEGASSLYHPEILKKPAARPGPGHSPATAATGPGASPDRHFFQGWIDYHCRCSSDIVLHHCQCSHSPSTPRLYSYTPKVCHPPQPEKFHHHETDPAPCLWPCPCPGGVTFWVTPSSFGWVLAVLASGWLCLLVAWWSGWPCGCGCWCGWWGVLAGVPLGSSSGSLWVLMVRCHLFFRFFHFLWVCVFLWVWVWFHVYGVGVFGVFRACLCCCQGGGV